METISSLHFNKCKLLLSENQLADFTQLLNEVFKIDVSPSIFFDLGSYWLLETYTNKPLTFDMHFKRTRDGVLLDNLEVHLRSRYLEFLDKIKDMFKKYSGTLWAWTYDGSDGKCKDFFKIENGYETKFSDPNDRPKGWIDSISEEITEALFKTIDFEEIRKKTHRMILGLYCDKCELSISSDELQSIIQQVFDENYEKEEIGFRICNEEEILKISNDELQSISQQHYEELMNRYIIIDTSECLEYNRILYWSSPIRMELFFNINSEDSSSLLNIEMSTSLEMSSSIVEFILKQSQVIIDLFLKRNGVLWAYFESQDSKFHFFKIEDKKVLRYPYIGRPDGW
jgi:hypothetical protein